MCKICGMSEKSYQLLCNIFAAVQGKTKDDLEPIHGKKFMGYASGNFERLKQKGSTATDYNAVDDSDEIRRVMMEVEPRLESSEKRN